MAVFDRATIAAALPDHELGPKIGQGAFAVVLAARHRGLGRDHAVKVLVDSDGCGEQTFRREAEAAASLDHMHVVHIHDYKFHEGLGLIVMERLNRRSLRDRINMGTTLPAQACVIGLAAAGALHAAHHKRHIHRDVKPTNILFTDDDCLRVVDFGIAKWMEGGTAVASRTVGTPGYMSPEQFGVGELRPASDVYALAIVLYELLAGSPPFSPAEPSLPSYMRMHLYADPPRPEGVPEPLVDVLIRALAKDARDRHPSAREFALDLAAAASRSLPAGWLLDAGMPLFVDEEVRELALGRPTGRAPSRGTTTWAAPTNPLARPVPDLPVADLPSSAVVEPVAVEPVVAESVVAESVAAEPPRSGPPAGRTPSRSTGWTPSRPTARHDRPPPRSRSRFASSASGRNRAATPADSVRASDTKAVDAPAGDIPTTAEEPRRGAREVIPGERMVIPATVLFMILLVAAAVTFGAFQDDYFVGDKGGRVTIFRGVNVEIAGFPLHRVEESYPLQVDHLPEPEQAQVRDGADMASLDEARTFVANLSEAP